MIYRCERPYDSPIMEYVPFVKHIYFKVDGKHIGLQSPNKSKTGISFVGEDRPIRKRSQTISKCYPVDIDKKCFYDVVNRNEMYGLESKSEIHTALSIGCIRWADYVECECGNRRCCSVPGDRFGAMKILLFGGFLFLLYKWWKK